MKGLAKTFIQLIAASASAYTAFRWLPLETWETMANGLLAFLGLLVAALVQVIPITAGFSQPEHVPPAEAERLGLALEKQQRLWLALLGLSFTTVILLVVGVAISPHGKEIVPPESLRGMMFPWFSGAIAFMLCFVVARALLLIPGVLSLQRLRNRLNVEASKYHERLRIQTAVHTPLEPPTESMLPEGFGRIVPHECPKGK